MGLESATYIGGLLKANPLGGDLLSTADDHLRLIKSAMLRTFPTLAGDVSASGSELDILKGAEAAGLSSGNVVYVDGLGGAAFQSRLNTMHVDPHNHARLTRSVTSGTFIQKSDQWHSLVFEIGASPSSDLNVKIGPRSTYSWSDGVEIEILQLYTGSCRVVVDTGVTLQGPPGKKVTTASQGFTLDGIGSRVIVRYVGFPGQDTDTWSVIGDAS